MHPRALKPRSFVQQEQTSENILMDIDTNMYKKNSNPQPVELRVT